MHRTRHSEGQASRRAVEGSHASLLWCASPQARLGGSAVREGRARRWIARTALARWVVIFVFEVHVGDDYTAEQYAEAWVQASEIIQRATGARGTLLHRKIGDPKVLLAIASWVDKPARDAAEAARHPTVQEIIDREAQHVRIRVIGEFEDPEWVVTP